MQGGRERGEIKEGKKEGREREKGDEERKEETG
jgi:hypothetical protein